MSQRTSLFSDVPQRLECVLCKKIMIEPVQTECGCRFCLRCISGRMERGELQCPECGDEVLQRGVLIEDRALEREMLRLEMECLNEGCEELFLFRDISDHLANCLYQRDKCDLCSQSYSRCRKMEHMTKECTKGTIVCEDCKREMTREEFTRKHKNYRSLPGEMCEMWISDCPYKCSKEKLFGMRIHLRSCPKRPAECPFKDLGCRVTGTMNLIDEHMKKGGPDHQGLMVAQILKLRFENSDLRKSYQEMEEDTKVKLEEAQRMKSEVEKSLQRMNKQMEKLEKVVESLSSDLMSLQHQGGGSSQTEEGVTVDNGQATWVIKDIRKKIKESTSGDRNQIVSPAFYISRPGYHLCLKVYLNGDGRGLNEYLSAFFVINRGDYDGQVSWPFRSRVTLSLLSSNPGTADLNVHMKPDDNPSCYGRPLSENNIGAGQPQFVRLVNLLHNEDYLHEGAVILRLSLREI